MIYLSRLELDVRCSQVRAEMANPYEMHRTLSKAFGADPSVWQNARCLFRLEETPMLAILVQSRFAPDWSCLTIPHDYLSALPCTKMVTPSFISQQTLAFRLRANPTVKRGGKRLGLYDETEQSAWLERKASAGGFRVYRATLSNEEAVVCRTAGGASARFSAVRFDGLLSVTDPGVFSNTLESGIGAGKGIGFGLLSVARAVS